MTPLRILIAEDDAAFHEEIINKITALGHTVVGSAYNAPYAIALAEELKPDIIILDIVMSDPETGREDKRAGFKATKAILSQFPVPIIWLTAYETPQMLEEAKELGVSAYLVKPPRSNEISRAITLAYARFADMQELRRLNAALQAEITLRERAEAALRQSEENLRVTLNSIDEAVVATDRADRIVRMNPAAERLSGWSQTEAIGKPFEQVLPMTRTENNEIILTTKDGREHYVTSSIASIKNNPEEILGLVMVLRDVTQQRHLHQELSMFRKKYLDTNIR